MYAGWGRGLMVEGGGWRGGMGGGEEEACGEYSDSGWVRVGKG